MTSTPWPRKTRATLSWQHLSAPEPDSGKRWAVIWDTARKTSLDGRNTALEGNERAALDRAKHLLRMGFVVYELREPTGAVLFDEGAIRERLGLKPEPSESAPAGLPTDEPDAVTAIATENPHDNLARDMIEVHGDGASGVARGNARTAALAGRTEQVRKWLAVVDVIQQQRRLAAT